MAKFREIRNPKIIVDAVQLTEETIYCTEKDEIKGNPGDWQVTHVSPKTAQVHTGLIVHENFVKIYEPLDIDDEVSHIAAETMQEFDAAEAAEVEQVNKFIEECKSQRSRADL